MQRRDLEDAAASYSCLRGLLFVPAGALAIVAALGNWEVGPLRRPGIFLLVVAAIALAFVPINRFYNEHYGRLSPSRAQELRTGVALVLAVAVMIGGSALLNSHASWSLDLPVNPIAVCFAAVMLITYAIGIGLRTHHVVIWGALLVIGALPVWNGPDPSNVGLLLSGVALMVDGLFDHRLFVQTFGPPEERAGLEERDAAA